MEPRSASYQRGGAFCLDQWHQSTILLHTVPRDNLAVTDEHCQMKMAIILDTNKVHKCGSRQEIATLRDRDLPVHVLRTAPWHAPSLAAEAEYSTLDRRKLRHDIVHNGLSLHNAVAAVIVLGALLDENHDRGGCPHHASQAAGSGSCSVRLT